jgi:hypothetical protein
MLGLGTRGNCLWTDNFCKGDDAGSQWGICSALPKLNEACGPGFVNLTRVCDEGDCVMTDQGIGSCQPFPHAGEPCTSRCVADAICANAADGGSVCVALPAAGQSCTETGGHCASSANCIISGICAAKAGPGEACQFDYDCLNGICLSGICALNCAERVDRGAITPGCPNGFRDLSVLLAGAGLVLMKRRDRNKTSHKTRA